MRRRLDEFQICFGVESRSGLILRSELESALSLDSSDKRKGDSTGLLLPRPFFIYLFRRLWVARWVSDLVAWDRFRGYFSSELRMLVLEAKRVTPVSLISLLGSVILYEPSYHGFSAGRRVDPAGSASGGSRTPQNPLPMLNTLSSVSVRESRIQYLCDPQWFRDTASRGPTTIVAPESQFRTCPTDHDSIGYPHMSVSGESSTTMHRLLHASGSHPIPTPYDPKTNQYNQDLGLIHSTNGNHLESPIEGSSIDHQVTIYLHAQNITMFPTNEIWYFASQILVSSSGGLILILTAQSTRN
ncbi:hypothetical protein F511_16088 [Dorcoceras hygrometricum]|uniref:Uncharacterized protein n=1 Tax=Dorcoceras hygrometricum TaxID=472368 RepID=A0A2Z7BWN3_9LAMI|nr:hypothetical protein F511_16088 [Dorcoceras hygrometricum]